MRLPSEVWCGWLEIDADGSLHGAGRQGAGAAAEAATAEVCGDSLVVDAVDHVEGIETEFEFDAFKDGGVLADGEVHGGVAGVAELVGGFVAFYADGGVGEVGGGDDAGFVSAAIMGLGVGDDVGVVVVVAVGVVVSAARREGEVLAVAGRAALMSVALNGCELLTVKGVPDWRMEVPERVQPPVTRRTRWLPKFSPGKSYEAPMETRWRTSYGELA